uniref:ADAM 17-like protease n=1 Tax=Styela clava TaxID=7725 RepID=UPI00193A23DA|nr:ADAM 17-like protease [Styela clava]
MRFTHKNTVIFTVLFLCSFQTIIANHQLKQRLKTWETISSDDITFHRSKRSLDGKVPTVDKEVSFNAFQRHFHLSLVPSSAIFAPNFKAAVYGRNGREEVTLDKTSLFTGSVMGESGSYVQAHLNGKELMASIKTKQDTYIIEPSWRHLPEDKDKLMIYRRSDLNMTRLGNPHKNDSYCDVKSIMDDIHQNQKKQEKKPVTSTHHRSKRSASKRLKICTLSLVADHRFYKEMGNSNYQQTMYYLINLIERVNRIFKTTNWGSEEGTDEYTGYGFQIADIKVYKESTSEPSFNSDSTSWSAKGLLEAFSEHNHGNCLAHLFTYVDFNKGVLGLAYVGASKLDAVGGICTDPYERGNGKPIWYLNTGLTTTRNWGQRILTLEADLVTTHELGHNFGAEHDNGEVKACSPGQSNNGNFIMYPAAVSGEHENNDMFSICSKNNVLPCLKTKATKCFHKAKENFCGNFKVEEGEECDAGYFGANVEDACCSKECMLKEGATCSQKNSVCCNENCQAASKTTLCYSEVPESCLRDTFCDGQNFTCPDHLHKDDNAECGDEGRCKGGKCQPFCATVGMKPCLCTDKKENFCLRCCAPAGSSGDEMIRECKPYKPGNVTHKLRNNAKCTLGYCNDNECVKQTQDVIERVWSIFEHIAPDKIGEFLADNIVGAVLVFSLLFWIPCGCLVNFVDKQREKQRREDDNWFTSKGHEFSRTNAYGGMFGSSNALHQVQKANALNIAAAKAGFGAKDQWRASKDKGAVVRKSQEKLTDSTNGLDDRVGRGDAIVVTGDNRNATEDDSWQKSGIFSKPKSNFDLNNDKNTPSASRSSTPRPQLVRQRDVGSEEADS